MREPMKVVTPETKAVFGGGGGGDKVEDSSLSWDAAEEAEEASAASWGGDAIPGARVWERSDDGDVIDSESAFAL